MSIMSYEGKCGLPVLHHVTYAEEQHRLDGAEVFVLVDNVSDGLSSVPDMTELYPGTKLAMRT